LQSHSIIIKLSEALYYQSPAPTLII